MVLVFGETGYRLVGPLKVKLELKKQKLAVCTLSSFHLQFETPKPRVHASPFLLSHLGKFQLPSSFDVSAVSLLQKRISS